MIRHIVCWTLNSSDPDERAAAVAGMRERLEVLPQVIPGLRSLTVSPDVGDVDANWDVVLVSEHDDRAALAAYIVHPAHVEAAGFTRSVVAERACVDVEL
ncbi:Dabb family protein [Microcella daejeonensis]|uniref:Dabb family protein n=1 Tax=Microcella daejeonensis TaxID=2994971 RepID=UPI00226E3C92|nr:Dabb family protein [Microcella daejeonensis]WAB84776.1 Dabb family protein [Microcella daejeonensis]